MQSRVRRGARRAVFAGLAGICAAVGAGFASFAGYAALRDAGLSEALSGLILASVWFGLGGILLMLRALVGDTPEARLREAEAEAERAAHTAAAAARASAPIPPLADAFSAGLAEGSAFANRRKAR